MASEVTYRGFSRGSGRNGADRVGSASFASYVTPRYAVLAAVILTYIWRFHDLAPILAPLRLAAIATVASWLFLLLRPRPRWLSQCMMLVPCCLYLAWTGWIGLGISSAISPDRAWTLWWGGQVKTVGMFLFFVSCLNSLRTVRFAAVCHVAGAFVLTAFYIKGGFAQWGSPVTMYDRNDLALVLNVALPMALLLATTVRNPAYKWLTWGAAIAIATSVMMSQSRGGFVALAVVALVLTYRARHLSLRVRLVPPVLVVVGILMLPATQKERLATILNPTEDYNFTKDEGRIEIWKRGLGYVRENPFTGVGAGNFGFAEARTGKRAQAVHSIYVQVISETGVPGVLLFLGLIAGAFHSLRRTSVRLRPYQDHEEALGLSHCAHFFGLSLLAYCVGGAFLSMAYNPLLPSLVAFVACLDRISHGWVAEHRMLSANVPVRKPRPRTPRQPIMARRRIADA